ncbi:MAG: hypothetical protein V4549_06685 [Bacteroidota bacterium]
MTIRNTINRNVYNVTPQEWDVIKNNGNSFKYEIVDDGAPMEVKSMRASQVQSKLPIKGEEIPVKITKKTKKQS